MENLVSLILFFATGFAVSMGAAWLFVKITLHLRNQLNPSVGAILSVRASSGIYRAHIVKLGSVWTISAPLQRDNYVPLRVGEEVVIEAASKHGALLFRTEILSRQTNPHCLIVKKPEKIHRIERREHKRWPHLTGSKVKIGGENGQLLDLSEGGARVQTSFRTHKGDRVKLEMPWGQAIDAWVLSREGNEARLRFEELLELRPGKRETAPAV